MIEHVCWYNYNNDFLIINYFSIIVIMLYIVPRNVYHIFFLWFISLSILLVPLYVSNMLQMAEFPFLWLNSIPLYIVELYVFIYIYSLFSIFCTFYFFGGFPVHGLPLCLWSLDWEDPLEKGKATHSRILAWRMPWTV